MSLFVVFFFNIQKNDHETVNSTLNRQPIKLAMNGMYSSSDLTLSPHGYI